MMLPIALTTAGAAALVNFWLAWRIGQVRTAEKISIGDGGNPRLIARMRAHLNFAEYVPLVLILIALIELARGTHLWLWIVALLFILGRVAHPIGMDGSRFARTFGMATTALTTVGLGLYAASIQYLAMFHIG
ncbi:MAPEG family protein [Sphingomonas sp. LB-2]|uniref:MAPEG family protein n=1 Tax=Sphingomonas caeni TaxID=2984949 RepID=UPI0022309AED|nr:MAPEG family protein [Sphingomonas caeni]MCW3846832.1 MAPEG family protein [Sphingomonas caeni]